MLDPFPWLLMAVYQLDQEHKVAGSVVEASTKALQQSGRSNSEDYAATTDGESTSRENAAKASAPKKAAKANTGKGGHGPKKQDQSSQHLKTIAMLKESLAKRDAELAKSQAENARLRGGAPPSDQARQEPTPLAKARGPLCHSDHHTRIP
jgi:hypothetical protein